eukprot:5201949-Alexandrium_andersonii.AAC.1
MLSSLCFRRWAIPHGAVIPRWGMPSAPALRARVRLLGWLAGRACGCPGWRLDPGRSSSWSSGP